MDVRVRDVPELTVVTEERVVDQPELEAWLPGAMARVSTTAGDYGGVADTTVLPFTDRAAFPAAPVFIVAYEGNPNNGPCTVVVCAPMVPGNPAPAGTPWVTMPAHREAYVRVTKDDVMSGALDGAYDAIDGWIATNGHEIAGLPRETYWTDFFDAAPVEDVFDVAFPIA